MFTSIQDAVEGVKRRIDFEMTEMEESIAREDLQDLQVLARLHGTDAWRDYSSTPDVVRVLIYRATVRHLRNIDGLIQSRAGDETVEFPDRAELGFAAFTEEEVEILKRQNGKAVLPAFGSIGTYVYGTKATGRDLSVDARGGALTDGFAV